MTEFDPRDSLYRGTSRGWPGSLSLQTLPMTCSSTDPLVATLFACLARSFGEGVVLIAGRGQFIEVEGRPNFFDCLECAVNLKIRPVDFAAKSRTIVPVDLSLDVLEGLGFAGLPRRFPDPTSLRIALHQTRTDSLRLDDDQILAYHTAIEDNA